MNQNTSLSFEIIESLGGAKTPHCNEFRIKYPDEMIYFGLSYASFEAGARAVKTPG